MHGLKCNSYGAVYTASQGRLIALPDSTVPQCPTVSATSV